MTIPYRALAELGLACAALGGAALSWMRSHSTVIVAPIIEGQPTTVSVVYHAPHLALAFLLVSAAGVLTVVGVARLRREQPD